MAVAASPNVIFNLAAHIPGDTHSNSSFYRCLNHSRNVIDYLTRQKALGDDNCAFNNDTFLGQDELEQYKQSLSLTSSNVWSTIISFTPEFAANICTSNKDAQKLVQKHLEKLFKNTDYDVKNIDFVGAFHTNTDNPHIHLVMFEKEPSRIDRRTKKLIYNSKYKLPYENIQTFTASFNLEFSDFKMPQFSLRDTIRQNFKTYCNSPVMLCNFASKSLQSIKEKGHFQYERLSKEDKTLVDVFTNQFLKTNLEVSKKHSQYLDFLLQYQEHKISLYRKNNYKTFPANVTNFYNSRVQELNSRLGNTLLQGLKHYSTLQDRAAARRQTQINLQNTAGKKVFTCKTFQIASNISRSMRQTTSAELLESLVTVNEDVTNINLKEFNERWLDNLSDDERKEIENENEQ